MAEPHLPVRNIGAFGHQIDTDAFEGPLPRSGDGGIYFWFPTLVGGGVLIIVGTLVASGRPTLGFVLTMLGGFVAIVPTMWTVLVPILLVVLLVSRARQMSAAGGHAHRSP